MIHTINATFDDQTGVSTVIKQGHHVLLLGLSQIIIKDLHSYSEKHQDKEEPPKSYFATQQDFEAGMARLKQIENGAATTPDELIYLNRCISEWSSKMKKEREEDEFKQETFLKNNPS